MKLLLATLILGWSPTMPPDVIKESDFNMQVKSLEQLATRQQVEINVLQTKIKDLESKIEKHDIQITYYKILSLRPNVNRSLATEIAKHVHNYSKANDIDEDLILAIIRVESYFDQYAKSYAKARGLSQIMLSFWRDECNITIKNIYDIETNVGCGVKVFLTYYKRYNDVSLALVSYNRGPEDVDRSLSNHLKINYSYEKLVKKFYKQIKSTQYPSASNDTRAIKWTIK